YAKYLLADFPEIETVARARPAQDSQFAYGERSLNLNGLIVDPEFLDIFDLPFVAGDARNALRQPSSVVLTEETATNLFGADDPLGKTVVITSVIDATVTGVISEIPEPSHLGRAALLGSGFDYLASWDVLERLRIFNNPNAPADPPENWFGGYGGITYALLPADGSLTADDLITGLEGFAARRLPAETLETYRLEVGAVPIGAVAIATLDGAILAGANNVISITTVLLILGGLVLGVACINYANLATARAAGRAREIGMRKVVGARRSQVLVQYLFEAALLTTLAVCVAMTCLGLLVPVLDAATGMELGRTVLGTGRFWLFLFAVIAAVTILAGAYPALVLSRVRPVEALRLGRIRLGPRFVSTLLVGAQFVAASFLLVVVLVMLMQNRELRQTGLGATSDPLLIIGTATRRTDIDADTLRAELLRIPQVEAVAGAGVPPWSGGVGLGILTRSPDPSSARRTSVQNVVGEDFFDVFGLTLAAGRIFDRTIGADPMPNFVDMDPEQAYHLMIDRALSEELGFESPQAAIDEIVYFPADVPGTPGEADQPLRIIGVVENRPLTFIGLGATSNFYSFRLNPRFQIARISADDVSGALEAIDAMWNRLAPTIPSNYRFVDEVFEENYRAFSRVSQILAGLSLFALFISTVGLFGMAIQVASRRTHEIGVRKTLGASTRQVIFMLLRDFAKPILVANLIAWPLA
ncbi:MAG: ABC transporter permease, partial [Myxococcota bacterium]